MAAIRLRPTVTVATAVIFDLDGTLVDTNYQHALAWYLAFREHDLRIPVWRIHRHIGMGGDRLVRAVAGAAVADRIGEQLRAADGAQYLRAIQTTSALPGSRELLAELKAQGCLRVRPTSRRLSTTFGSSARAKLVAGWITAADVANTKPDPDVVVAALEKLEARDAVMVGDTPLGCRRCEESRHWNPRRPHRWIRGGGATRGRRRGRVCLAE